MDKTINKFIDKLQTSIDDISETESQLIMINKSNTEQLEMYVIMLENIIDEYYNLCHVMFKQK